MKAFLLAAGNGTRLRPITDTIPKCLVPVCGVPMLAHWLEFARRADIDELLINLHSKAEQVRDWLHGNARDIRVNMVEENELLGSAGTLRANRAWIGSDPEFWVFYADVLTNLDAMAMLAFHRQRQPAATLGVYKVDDPHRCGIVVKDAVGRITDFQEKPANPKGNEAFSGILIGTQALLDEIPDGDVVDLGAHVLPNLIGRTYAYPIVEYLIDIGTRTTYELAQTTWPGFQPVESLRQ